jgi:hypothetical protein
MAAQLTASASVSAAVTSFVDVQYVALDFLDTRTSLAAWCGPHLGHAIMVYSVLIIIIGEWKRYCNNE